MTEELYQKTDGARVIVIGLDGGTFDVLNPMMEQGIMPNLADLVREGAYGEMDTYVTGLGQGWASFMTGKDQKRHGVFEGIAVKG